MAGPVGNMNSLAFHANDLAGVNVFTNPQIRAMQANRMPVLNPNAGYRNPILAAGREGLGNIIGPPIDYARGLAGAAAQIPAQVVTTPGPGAWMRGLLQKQKDKSLSY